jgi:ribosomal-protein-alanine N-acetyltransferase
MMGRGDVVVLETPRLILTLPGPSAAAAVVDYYSRNREHLGPWEPSRQEGFYEPAHWRRRLAADRAEFRDGRSMRLFLMSKDRERILGNAHFTDIAYGPVQACLLGYGLDGEIEGQGFMSEALRSAIGYVFDELGLHRIMANYRPTNERSGRLLRRLGFVVEGYARDYLLIDGEWRDHVLTALTRPTPDDPR